MTHPLHISDFRYLLLSRFTSGIATSGMVVIIGYQLYDVARGTYHMSITQASFALGLLGLVQFLPLLILTPLAGVVVDRFERHHVAVLSMILDTLVALILAIVSMFHLVTLALLFLLAAAHGVARVFVRPALNAMAPNVVPVDVLPHSIALGSIAMQGGNIAGPALAGQLYGAHTAAPYWLSALLLLIGAGAMLLISPMPPPATNRDTHPLRQMTEGFRYVLSERFLLGCMTLDLFAVLLGGATALLPAYARDILHVGAKGLGQMRAAPALGAAVTGLLLSTRPLRHNVGVRMLQAVAVYGLATAVFGISHWYPLSLAMLALLGAADMISVFIRNTLVQLRTPDDRRGRVSAISGLAISASNELGEMESGMMAAALGPVGAVVAGGIAAIGITALWAGLFPEIRNARSFSTSDE